MFTVIVSGLIMGLLYALAGLGLVVVYRTSKVLNFGIGGLGAAVTYVALDMLEAGIPQWLTLAVSVLVGALLGGVIELSIARPLQKRPHLTVSVATLAALLILEGLLGLRYGFSPRSLEPAFSTSSLFSFGFLNISAYQIFIVVLSALAIAALFLLLQKTRLGTSMRAVSSGPLTASILGVNIGRVRFASWLLGGAYGALAALLVTPLTYLSPTSFTTFLLTAFGAVVLGGFTSVLGVVIGAVVFGVATNLLLTYLDSRLIATYTFLLIGIVLSLRPNGLFGKRERDVDEPSIPTPKRQFRRAQVAAREGLPPTKPVERAKLSDRSLGRFHVVLWCVAVVALALVPFVGSNQSLFLVSSVLASFIGILGLNVLVGFSGQVSLGHSAFLAIGAYTAAIAYQAGVPTIIGLGLAGVAGAVAGLILGLPSTRLSGIYLTVVTLVFAFAIPELVLLFSDVTGGASGLPLPVPELFAGSRNTFWFIFGLAIVVALIVLALTRTRIGRGWKAVSDSPTAARSLGLNPAAVKLGAFTFGSALTAISGALTGMLIGYIGVESFGVFISIYALLAIVLGGTGSVIGSLFGAFFIVLVPDFASRSGVPQDFIFGIAVLLVMYFAPGGFASLLDRVASLVYRLIPHKKSGDAAAEVVADSVLATATDENAEHVVPLRIAETTEAGAADKLLELRQVSGGYGHDHVLKGVSLDVQRGEIVALLGANGAGKSTVLRAISGIIPLEGGEMYWQGKRLTDRGAQATLRRARSGIAQVPEGRGIFPDLTVKENLWMGTFSGTSRSLSEGDLEQVFQFFPILKEKVNHLAGSLSGGQQQMLAIGRALISKPTLLMLDEPSLGLAPIVSQQVFAILRDIAHTGVSILLVEQNARASLRLADRAYVLSRGQVVMSSKISELTDETELLNTYLAMK